MATGSSSSRWQLNNVECRGPSRPTVAAMNREQEEGDGGPDHAAHLAAMWAGQSNVIVAVRIRPVRCLKNFHS